MSWLKEKYRSWLSLLALLFGAGRKSLLGFLVVHLFLFFNGDLKSKCTPCSVRFHELQFPCPLHEC